MLGSSARAIRDEIAAGTVSAVEVCRAFLERIEAVNPSLNAFNLIAADRALARAGDVTTDVPLHGWLFCALCLAAGVGLGIVPRLLTRRT